MHLFNEGTHSRLYAKLGAHAADEAGVAGVRFAVWAPNAERVSVVGDFNAWRAGAHPLHSVGVSGIWSGFVAGVAQGALYKYAIATRGGGTAVRADPFAFRAEPEPGTALVVWDLAYAWDDGAWMAGRARRNAHDAAIAVYELHLGSWMRVREDGNRSLSYRELADRLTDYVVDMASRGACGPKC